MTSHSNSSNRQLALTELMESSDGNRTREIDRYIRTNKRAYLVAASREAPTLLERNDVIARFAFAILSANTTFDAAVKALRYCAATKWFPTPKALAQFQCVPSKADYICLLAGREHHLDLLRHRRETWQEYRERIVESVYGLARPKASFAIGLVYPLHADVACIDTWLCKVAFPYSEVISKFRWLRKSQYLQGEDWVRRFAIDHDVSTFLAQWMIWDFARGGKINTHDIFADVLREAF